MPYFGPSRATTLYDATTGTASLVASGSALSIQPLKDFVSHGRLDVAGFTFAGHQFPTWFDPSQAAWNVKGWFAFDFDGTDHNWVSQHWGFATKQGASVTVGTAGNHLDLFEATGQGAAAIPNLTLWDEDGVTKRLTMGSGDGPNAMTWWSENGTDVVNIYSINDNPEIDVQHLGGGQFNIFTGGGGAQVTARWHGTPDSAGVTIIGGGTEGFIGVMAHAGETGTMFQLDADGHAGLIQATANNRLGFFGTTAVAKPTGVAVSAAGVHAALVTLGLIAA